jgi:hypothetical protein
MSSPNELLKTWRASRPFKTAWRSASAREQGKWSLLHSESGGLHTYLLFLTPHFKPYAVSSDDKNHLLVQLLRRERFSDCYIVHRQ